MDFHSLNRRELQALCKLNKIPANMTNIAMADALKSLETVEGIEEILNPSRSETTGSSFESCEELEVMTPRVPRTICRTSTRQKVKKTEAESVPATVSRTTGRGVRKQLAGEVNELKTPMVSSTRKKVPTTSCRNVGSQLNECEEVAKNDRLVDHETRCIPNTPVAVATYSQRKGTTVITHQDTVKKETAVQRVYSTRRSTRLTAKKSAEPGVMERERSEPVKIDSFLDEPNVALEEDSSLLVPEKSAGSGSGSVDMPHESNISSEDLEDKAEEESVENCNVGVSKAKVEGICNAFEKLDVLVVEGNDQNLEIKKGLHVNAPLESEEEKVDCCGELDDTIEVKSVEIFEQGSAVDSKEIHNVGGKLVLNEADDCEVKDVQVDNLKPDAVLAPEEHSDSFFYNKASPVSEADNFDADAISIKTENSNYPLMTKLEDVSFAVSETKTEVSECNVDVVLDDIVNPMEQDLKMDFRAPAEEPQESLIEETDINTANLDSKQLNHEADHTMDEGHEVTHESVAGDSFTKEENQFPTITTEAIKYPIHFSPMKKQDLSNSPTSGIEMSLDNNENSEAEVQVVAEENGIVNGKAVDEKAKISDEMSLRQLKKQLKALSIKNNTEKDDKMGEGRPALQAVCDNQLVTGDMEN